MSCSRIINLIRTMRHWCTDTGNGLAADCIRHDYASLAENAYPEAYSEFKHSMLLLIFDEQLQASPVKQDWSLQTRSDLAGMLCRTLRQTAGTSYVATQITLFPL